MRAQRVLGFLLFCGSVWAQQYVISTIAGGSAPPTPAAAAKASVGDPTRVAVDAAGNVYFSSLHSIFKVDSSGTMTRFAGNGRPGNSGDGGQATSAQLMFPMGLAVDAAGNVFVADRDANVVRRIAPTGIIQTVAGNGTPGYQGDFGPATAAQLNAPFAVAVDPLGTGIFIADFNNQVVRKVMTNGTIFTYAGNGTRGYFGDGGGALSAWFDGPEGVAVDANGVLYIADTFNGRIRRVATDSTITTVAGLGSTGVFGGDNGPPASAALSLPTDVAVDRSGNPYIADFGNSRVRVVANAVITTVAGRNNGAPIVEGEEAVNTRLNGPTGVAVDRNGNFYFVEAGIGSGTGLARGDYKVWKVSSTGIMTTLAGNGLPSYAGDGASATTAQFDTPTGVAIDASGGVLIADSQNQRLRKVARGIVTTIAGTGTVGFNGEVVLPSSAQFNTPRGVAADASGNYYVADTGNRRVREGQPGGNLFTKAGNGNASYFGDGLAATQASVNQPEGVAVDTAGNLYIADTFDNVVRKVTADGVIHTIAGFGTPGFSGDGGAATSARLNRPRSVAVDALGNVYVADTGNNRIRKIDALGNISTVAGDGSTDLIPADGVATQQGLADPRGVAVDRAGNVYVAETGHNRVRKISPAGTITTIAGNGQCCYTGDGGLGTAAQLNQPWGLAVDSAGNVYVADSGNNAIRLLAPVSAAIQVGAVVNAASNLAGPVAPGELVVLYGTGLAGVQSVLFNGVAGPLIYTSAGQTGAAVPYATTGGTVQVVAQATGTSSAPASAAVAATAPGVFTQDGSGRGQAAAVNQDGTPNSTGSPAPAGSVISLFATGEGQTSPAGVDGKTAGSVLPTPIAPVSVTIGGVSATVNYAGGAPGSIAGVMQVNAVVPSGVSGSAPVVVTVGGVSSQGGVTVVVK
jgi:uncharacterized protein (TIGR03437 family)